MALPLIVPSVNPCSGCGECCKDFGGDGVSTGLALFPDEFRIYAALAHERGLVFESVPRIVAVDRDTGRGIVSHYIVLTQPCVFHADGVGCSIYAKRPLVCRAFPYSISSDGDLLVGHSTAREGFVAMADQLGEEAPGIAAARMQHERRDIFRRGLQACIDAGNVSLNTQFYHGTVDVDVFLDGFN